MLSVFPLNNRQYKYMYVNKNLNDLKYTKLKEKQNVQNREIKYLNLPEE